MNNFGEFLKSDLSLARAFVRYSLCCLDPRLEGIKQKEFDKYFLIKFNRHYNGHYPAENFTEE